MSLITPPHSLDAEQAVLGAVLMTGSSAAEGLLVERGLRAEHFYRKGHATIWRAITAMVDSDRRVDELSVAEHLAAAGELNGVGGRDAIDALAAAVPAAGNVDEYALRVIDLARHRHYMRVGDEFVAAGLSRDDARAANAERMLAESSVDADPTVGPDQAADAAWDFLSADGPEEGLVPLPWPKLNRAFAGGLRRGNLTFVGAWSSRGKSCLVDGVLEHAAARGLRAALYLNEMSVDERTLRFTAAQSGVAFTKLMERNLTPDERQRAAKGLALFRQLRIPQVPIAGWTVEKIARHIRRKRWDVCAIDLVGRIPSPPGVGRTTAVDDISRTLNDVALQADCHVLVVGQLHRGRDKDARKPAPTGSDIRESAALYNDAANVLFLHREQVELDDDLWEDTTDALIYTDKARNAPGGSVRAVFNPNRMRFVEAT